MKKQLIILTIIVVFGIFIRNIYQLKASPVELKFDDGTSERSSSPWSDEPGSEIAVRFTPPGYPFQLQEVKFYITSSGKPNTSFKARIYDSDIGDYPGIPLDKGNIISPGSVGDEWVELDLSQHIIIITEGDFFVSMYWITAPGANGNNAQFLGSDLNSLISQRSFFKWGDSGAWVLRQDRNMMIRVVGSIISSIGNVFSDVLSDYWAYDYIIAIYDAAITTGCAQDDPSTPENERRYCPEDDVTRGQMAAFIIRAKYGETFSYSTTPYFTDVPSTHTFFKYVQKLRDDGITVVSGTYGVDTYVTRGQMAAFIIRTKFGETFSYTTTPYFSDVPSTHGFFKYVQKLKDDGITTVTGTYGVDNIVTRAQMAAFLARAFLGME